jgi:5-methylcytosine-specific restriction endonuclease McrA
VASRIGIIRKQYVRRLQGGEMIPCALCNELIPVPPIGGERDISVWSLTMDHIVPVSKGGTNRVDNLQPAHFRCNKRKGNNDT